jgi:AraC-like DNA-binding protein
MLTRRSPFNDRSSRLLARNTAIEIMDALSDVLRWVRLTGAVFLSGELSAPWGVSAPSAAEATTAFVPGAEHLVFYHLVTEGSCVAIVAGCDPVPLEAGDVVLFPHGNAHVMASAPDVAALPAWEVYSPPPPGEVVGLRCGGGGEVTRLVCGFLACEKGPCNPLLDSLPPILRVNVRADPAATWIEASLRFGACEAAARRSGGATVLAKLSELLFVEAVRCFIESLPAEETGWLAGLRDRFVGRALTLMHARPAHAWTVEELGREVGLSRSALAERFATVLGQPPVQYLTRWRLQLAARRLRSGHESVARIAEEVGYESEAAFNRAFKREIGTPPATWRRSSAERATPAAASAE